MVFPFSEPQDLGPMTREQKEAFTLVTTCAGLTL